MNISVFTSLPFTYVYRGQRGNITMAADPTALIQQLTLLAKNPEAFSQHQKEIFSLVRKAATVLETPFELIQRVPYSVCTYLQTRRPDVHILDLGHILNKRYPAPPLSSAPA